jgi:putative flippase GtrA
VVQDLRGVLRMSTSGPVRQLWSFGLVGAAGSAAYALLFWLLRSLLPAAAANAAALIVTTVANTAANRRFTFGVQGRAGLAADHAGGLVALGLALTTTNLAMAALQAAQPHAAPATELAVLAVASGAATLLRFVLLRRLIGGRRPLRAEVIEIPRRHA